MTRVSSFEKVIEESRLIHKDYSLCDYCLGRLFSKKLSLSSNKLLGKKIHQKLPAKKPVKCYVCKNLLDDLEFSYKKIIESTNDYQFSSFLIGVVLKPSVVDRDDFIRSKFKLRGIDSVKSDISRELAKKFSKATKSLIDYRHPELTIIVNFKKDSIELRSKSITLYGRYAKNSRNLPQKQKPCERCMGSGCLECNYHGISDFNSVEGRISEFLYDKFCAKQVKITWIGGEDQSSLVVGNGRPFFVQILNPHKRKLRFFKKISLQEVTLFGLTQVESIPKEPLKFRSKIELFIKTENKIQADVLKKLNDIKNSPVAVYENSKRNEKLIHSIQYQKTKPNSFTLVIEVDGGLPIKKFVDSETVFPNLSDLLETKCVCEEFDFHEIIIQ